MKKLVTFVLLLALILSFSASVFAETTEDIETLITNANKGDSHAMAELGMAYYTGSAIKRNYSKALSWLLKAADAGETECYYTIGTIYEKGGDDVSKDMNEAMSWYNKAAENGDEDAKIKLGLTLKKSEPQPEKAQAQMIRLDGVFGQPELVRGGENGGLEHPFYPDAPVVNCSHVKLSLAVRQKQGICTGNYYLYVKDLDGKWHHTAVFKLKENHINGDPVMFDLELDTAETFVAVALWPADKGMDFTALYNYAVFVDSNCVSEYSVTLPKPHFEESSMNCAAISMHFRTSAYKNPYAAFNDWVNDVVGPGGINDFGDMVDLWQDMEEHRLNPDD